MGAYSEYSVEHWWTALFDSLNILSKQTRRKIGSESSHLLLYSLKKPYKQEFHSQIHLAQGAFALLEVKSYP